MTLPSSLLLPRLDGVQKTGQGWRARCPSHEGKSCSLAISEGDNGTLLLHCFAGCSAADVVAATGLTISDLFVRRDLRTMTPAERSAFLQAALIPKWRAALEVLGFEACVTLVAARQLAKGCGLKVDDLTRLDVACQRITDARGVLHG